MIRSFLSYGIVDGWIIFQMYAYYHVHRAKDQYRRDAARAVGEALVDPDFQNKKIQVWTNEVGS